ncbi:TonB-dependent copper receptor [Martelella alba]|uniref:TonB-dependent copper receptor n=1 Tax=Martelella alba TaxID=2590451 RepID=A0ABY2SGZ0_9HYPH|nr:TonB-dependent copper receptor [Martelella alba]TKI03852.1 TonB-dependent copper receptor [Martelella alba]
MNIRDFYAQPVFASRRFVRLLPLLALAVVGGAGGESLPAESAEDPRRDAFAADVITVSAPRDSPLTVVTSPRLPRQPVPASDGADYLKTIPGFSLLRNGGTNGDPVFRGMFGSRLKILAGGAEMLGACPGRMDAPTSYISPESFDLLTLVKGPQTVLWGPGASAGVLRFERTRPRFDASGVGIDANILAGSNRRFDENFDGWVGGEQGYLQVIGTHSTADDYRDGKGRRVPSRWRKWSGDVVAGWTPDEATLLSLSGGKGDGEASYASRGMDGSRFRRESLGARLEKQRTNGDGPDYVEAEFHYNYIDHIMDNSSPRRACCGPVGSGRGKPHRPARAQSKNLDRRIFGGRAQADWLGRSTKLQTGIDMQTDSHRAKHRQQWRKDARFDRYGVFGELTWFAGEQHRWISGARFDHIKAQKFASSGREDRVSVTPGGFVRLEHRSARWPVMLYAGLGYTERFPDYWELFSPVTGPGGEDPFVRLKPEKTRQLDIGAHYSGAVVNGWLSGYLASIDDFILTTYYPRDGYRRGVENIAATALGGEMGLEYRLSEHWKTDGSLAYAWGRNRSEHRPLPQIPPLEARLGLTYERERWSLAALWRVAAGQRRVALNEGNAAGRDYGASAGFGVLSANAAFKAGKDVKVSGGIDNIFNKNYSEHLNLSGHQGFGYTAGQPISEPGRTLWAKLNVAF